MYVSIVVTLSRPENIKLVFDNIDEILKDTAHTYELVLAIDNQKIRKQHIEEHVSILNNRIRNLTLFNTDNPPPRKFDMQQRRTRIACLRNESKEYIGGSEFVFSFEDDTVLSKNALAYLLYDYNELDNVGFVQGVQIGRWGKPYIGAWRVDDVSNPKHYETIDHEFSYSEDEEIITEEIDAGGFYCYLTTTKLYKSIKYGWQEPCGADVDFGLQLRRLGYKNYIDWFVICGHKTNKEIIYPERFVTVVSFDFTRNRWISKLKDHLEIKQ